MFLASCSTVNQCNVEKKIVIHKLLFTVQFSNLRDFLQSRPEGRSILAYHEAHKDLSNAMRNELVRIILLEGLNLKLTLDSKFHSLMTGKIIQLFPGEKQV